MDISDKKCGRPWLVKIPKGKEGDRPCNYCTRDDENCRWKSCAAYRQWTKLQWDGIQKKFGKRGKK